MLASFTTLPQRSICSLMKARNSSGVFGLLSILRLSKRSLSSGCLRLTNEDVTDLYSRVNVGTKVIVKPMTDRRADLGMAIR